MPPTSRQKEFCTLVWARMLVAWAVQLLCRHSKPWCNQTIYTRRTLFQPLLKCHTLSSSTEPRRLGAATSARHVHHLSRLSNDHSDDTQCIVSQTADDDVAGLSVLLLRSGRRTTSVWKTKASRRDVYIQNRNRPVETLSSICLIDTDVP